VRAITDSESDIVTVAYEDAYGEGFEDMLRRVPDISKVDRLLDWRPTMSLDRILRDVVEHEIASSVLEPDGATSAAP
jgi:UDP-glucose 4-epimerase